MDEYNVIIPTSDLDTLEQEMDSWIRLSYKARRLSNDACLRKYNCTVNDLYLKLKNDILAKKDIENTDDNNLDTVIEAVDPALDDFYPDYTTRLSMSNALCQDANIVIINPNDSEQEIKTKYTSYTLLNCKFRHFSNDYSEQIWGYSIGGMYRKLRAKYSTIEAMRKNDENNLTIEAFTPMLGRLCHLTAKCVETKLPEVENIDDPVAEATYNIISADHIEKLNVSVPKISPWFTVDEMTQMGIKFTHKNPRSYIQAVKEAGNDEAALLNLGWNPSLEINMKSLSIAYNRQVNWFEENFIPVYEEFDTIINTDKKPIFIVIENPLPDSEDISKYPDQFYREHYTKYGISFDPDLSVIFTVELTESNNIYKFTLDNLSSYKYFEVVAFMVRPDVLCIIKDSIAHNTSIEFNDTLYRYIYNGNSNLDRTNEKLIYAMIINNLYKIANISGGYDKESDNYIMAGFYRLFKGNLEEFDKEKIYNFIHIIENNK